MANITGWVFLIGSVLWGGLVSFTGFEPSINQIVGNAAMIIAGAILIRKGKDGRF